MKLLKIFVSHIGEEKEFVLELVETLSIKFPGAIDFFVSSDSKKLRGGDQWFNVIKKNIEDADIVFVICSKNSVKRPWINFEAGAGYMLGIRTIPLCHSGLKPIDLPKPFEFLHAYDLSKETDIKALFELIAEEAKLENPSADYFEISEKLSKLDICYKSEEMAINILSGADCVYNDAISLIKEAQKIIRATALSDKNKLPNKEYIENLANILKKSKQINKPIEYRLIASAEVDLSERLSLFEDAGVRDLVKVKRVESPWPPNILLIDNKHMHISFIELPSDRAFRRSLRFYNKPYVVQNIVDWYDNYLWNNPCAMWDI